MTEGDFTDVHGYDSPTVHWLGRHSMAMHEPCRDVAFEHQSTREERARSEAVFCEKPHTGRWGDLIEKRGESNHGYHGFSLGE
jgi:hypothetical protein